MKFFDLFAGIGGFRLGMEAAGHTSVGWCEYDKFAQKSYKTIHNTEGEYFNANAREIIPSELPEFEVLCAGFPCQSFSIAGKRGGFEDTRGTLFFEIARIAREKLPKILFLENVKGLLNHANGKTFLKIIETLDELGYDCEWQVLNSKHFSTKERPTPQNRERVFIIGHLGGFCGRQVFPIRRENKGTLRQLGNYKPHKSKIDNPETGRVYDQEGVSPCLNTMQGGDREPKFLAVKEATKKGYDIAEPGDSVNYQFPNSETRRGRVGKGEAKTLETSANQGVVTGNLRIRKLTPKECWRLQGFPDWAFKRAAEVNSDTQLYKQAGNSVTVNVIEAIARRL